MFVLIFKKMSSVIDPFFFFYSWTYKQSQNFFFFRLQIARVTLVFGPTQSCQLPEQM